MTECGSLPAVFLLASGVAAGSAPVRPPYSGQGDCQVDCSSCHGTGGRGDRSIARSLEKQPPDLTRLATLNSGVFPDAMVLKNVDSRLPGSAHDSDTPAWDDVFAKSADRPGADNAALRIRTLVDYLGTLQVKQ